MARQSRRWTAAAVPPQGGILSPPPHAAVGRNARNDYAFLKKAVPPNYRQPFERAVEQGWLEPDHAGGIGEMKKLIEGQIAMDQPRRLRTWALFDSDARSPGNPSRDSQATLKACETWGIAYHQLERRAIENYLPPASLYAWAARKGGGQAERRARRKWADAYCAMTTPQQHHFNMKKGFGGDAKSGSVSDIYNNPTVDRTGPLSKVPSPALADCWLSADFHVDVVDELKRNDSEPERIRLYQSLLARV